MGALKEKGRRLSQVERVPYANAFLIGDLLTSRITMLTGEPKAGKTLLAVGMVSALINGEADFLGLPVHRRLNHVVFGLTDDGADEELRERFVDSIDESKVTVFPVEGTDSPDYWAGVADDLQELGADLFVLDNMLGALGDKDDISNSVTGSTFMRNLKPIPEAGIPVLVVTHTPKGVGEGISTASSVIGGRAIAGGSRGVIALQAPEQGGRRIKTKINRAQRDLNMLVEVRRAGPGADVPVWTVREKPDVRERSDSRKAREEALVQRVLAEQPAGVRSMNALGNHYDGTDGWKAQTIRKRLTPRVAFEGNRWVLRTG